MGLAAQHILATLGRYGDENDSVDEQASCITGAVVIAQAAHELELIRKILQAVFADK